MRLPAGMRPLVSTPWIWSKGCWGGLGVGMTRGALGLRGFMASWGSADLDEVWVAVQAEGLAACGRDVEWGPDGVVEESDYCAADGLEAGEAVDDLGFELGGGGFVGLGWGQGDFDCVFLGNSGDVGARSFGVELDGDGADEAEVDDVAGEDGVVAVAQGGEDVGFGEHLFR